jgi:hypothetical protein
MSKKLAAFVHVDGKVYGPGDDVPAKVAEAITNPKAWGDVDAEGDGGTGEDDGYGSWKAADLKAEIKARNEGRDDSTRIVPEGGKNADLVAALEADDAAAAEGDGGTGEDE